MSALKNGLWTPEEDEVLKKAVLEHGTRNWTAVLKHSGLNRSINGCRNRWNNYLRPDLEKGDFTHDEANKIHALHKRFGNQWDGIAQQLPGRTANDIRHYWYSGMKKPRFMQHPHNPHGPHQPQEINVAEFADKSSYLVPSTTPNSYATTSWPGTEPQQPTYYNNPCPSSVTVSRGYPSVMEPLQEDRSAYPLDTSVPLSYHLRHSFAAPYGIGEPHVQGNHCPYLEGDIMSTATRSIQDPQRWEQRNMDPDIHQQQQEQPHSTLVPSTFPNSYSTTSWPGTEPQPPTYHYNSGPSSVTASRGYPSMDRSASQLDTSVPLSNAPSNHFQPFSASASGISEIHVPGNQIPYTEVLSNSCDLPDPERARSRGKAVASEYQFEGDIMSTVTDPMANLIQDFQCWEQQNTDPGFHQQQQQQEQRRSYVVPSTTPNSYTTTSWPVTDYYNAGHSSEATSRGYPSMEKQLQVDRSDYQLDMSVPSSSTPYDLQPLSVSDYGISEPYFQETNLPCTEENMMSTVARPMTHSIQDPQRWEQQNMDPDIHRQQLQLQEQWHIQQQQHNSELMPPGFSWDDDLLNFRI